MTDPRQASAERGSAVIEFIVIGVAVLVPMVYIVQCVMTVHSAVLATTQAAREAARAFSTAATAAEGQRRARAAARLAFTDQGIELPVEALRVRCVDGPCLAPGSAVVVTVDWQAPLPWIPDAWSSDAAVPVRSSQRVPVDELRSDQ